MPNAPKKADISTTRQTAGPGFAFEDFVSARQLARILSGESLPGVGKLASVVQSQANALGWHIDDLLISTSDHNQHLAISCKSNVQVTRNGLPAEFVNQCWSQWNEPKEPFNRATDTLVLVTRGTNEPFTAVWADIKEWSGSDDPKLAIKKIRKTNKHARVFDSVTSPGGVRVASDDDALLLINHVEVEPTDFQIPNSTFKQDGINRCRAFLRDHSREDAEKVWDELVRLSRDNRLGSGTLLIETVWDALRREFELENYPNFEKSWAVLDDLSDQARSKIQTSLPNGVSVDRGRDEEGLHAAIQKNSLTVVLGESGVGKSALVKSTLDGRTTGVRKIWLGAEEIQNLLGSADRAKAGILQSLSQVFAVSTSAENVLVLDAIEKVDPNLDHALFELIRETLDLVRRGEGESEGWRVILVTQSASWRDRFTSRFGKPVEPFTVQELEESAVTLALSEIGSLRWLAGHYDAVSILRNPRVLAWVSDASEEFGKNSQVFASLPDVVNRVWGFWTSGKHSAARLLMRMAELEANFVQSFSLLDLAADEASTIDEIKRNAPLRETKAGRIQFEHDLAADWVRYEYLRQLDDAWKTRSSLISNPVWTNAWRLYAQSLIREDYADGFAWDVAFVEAANNKNMLLIDMLLDALFLDHNALSLLESKADLLFAEDGKWLDRLLTRFLHVATLPRLEIDVGGLSSTVALHLQSTHRDPIVRLWPPIAVFLSNHSGEVAEFLSPIVAQVCELWLTRMPWEWSDGTKVPYRIEFSIVALALARSLQYQQGCNRYFPHQGENRIYRAAFSGAPNLPDEVAQWALEMSQRRSLEESIQTRIAVYKASERLKYEQKLADDNEFRKRQEELKRLGSFSLSSFGPSVKLPPWPDGPNDFVENDFADTCLSTGCLTSLMRVLPNHTAEILLAVLIEANPERRDSDFYNEDSCGLQHRSGDGYPTIYWRSPFFYFLEISTNTAIQTLIRLVNFCTERSIDDSAGSGFGAPVSLMLEAADGSAVAYRGTAQSYSWAQENSHASGHLHCALNALEFWLVKKIKNGDDVSPYLERLLNDCRCLAIVGVLTNIAKFEPNLLAGSLKSLVCDRLIFKLDASHVKNFASRFESFAWWREGQIMSEAAFKWANEAYRKRDLVALICDVQAENPEFAKYVSGKVSSWSKPEQDRDALEFDLLCASLDMESRKRRDPTEECVDLTEFVCPSDLIERVYQYQSDIAPEQNRALLAFQCLKLLQSMQKLNTENALYLSGVLNETGPVGGDSNDEFYINRAAAAATLLVCAPDWLAQNAEIKPTAIDVLCSSLAATLKNHSDDYTEFGSKDRVHEFATYAAFYGFLTGDSDEDWEGVLVHLLASGSRIPVSLISGLCFQHRDALGSKIWRVLQIGLFWSALSMYLDRYRSDDWSVKVWSRWRSRFLRLRISDVEVGLSSIDLLSIWKRLERLRRRQARRLESALSEDERRYSGGYASWGLNSSVLRDLFSVVLDPDVRPSGEGFDEVKYLVGQLWKYETAFAQTRRKEDGEYDVSDRFGYDLAWRLSYLAANQTEDKAVESWKPILELGPDAHFLISQFVSGWFLEADKCQDVAEFCKTWRNMIEFALEQDWTGGRRYYKGESLLRELLGLDSDTALSGMPDGPKVVGRMSDLYERWARKHLSHDEDNLRCFASFIASEVGSEIRIDGIKWIAASFEVQGGNVYWRRDENTGSALVHSVNTAISEQHKEFTDDPDFRSALLSVAAKLVEKQAQGAMTLQERIRQMGR